MKFKEGPQIATCQKFWLRNCSHVLTEASIMTMHILAMNPMYPDGQGDGFRVKESFFCILKLLVLFVVVSFIKALIMRLGQERAKGINIGRYVYLHPKRKVKET